MIILGIETSCDDTAVAMIEVRVPRPSSKDDRVLPEVEYRILGSLVHTQASLHSPYGGVYPNLAKREHGRNIAPLLGQLFSAVRARGAVAMAQAPLNVSSADPAWGDAAARNPELCTSLAGADYMTGETSVPQIDAIAVTAGPGLEPALWVGIECAKILSKAMNVPLIPVDHMEGHILGSLLTSDAIGDEWQYLHHAPLPALALLISGGHTELVLMRGYGQYEVLGATKDDAVGEAFDKTARLLGLPYPGGPHIAALAEAAAAEGIRSTVRLPRPMISSGDLDFSFSGLKTAVLYAVREAAASSGNVVNGKTVPGGGTIITALDPIWVKGLAREFTEAVTETLDTKLRAGLSKSGARSIIIGGGVSANMALRQAFGRTAAEHGIPIYLPTGHISGDNALMIALTGAVTSIQEFAQTRTAQQIKTAQDTVRADGTKKLGSGKLESI